MTSHPARDPALHQAVLRLNAVTTALGVGLLLGFGLFAATMVLVMRGGPDPGPHLALLGQFLPGYTVTTFGAVLGFFYAFVFGYCGGFFVAHIYNRLAL